MDANGYDGLKFGEGITKDDITITQEADGFVYIRINNTHRCGEVYPKQVPLQP
ncbi:hypothetical protein BSPWISOXPB_3015 [uncultured Gammaproteobacteria bacterium]|nr:hypothetical protein BSPWISOXPB_3015 [uncultured Gammaproteobacteria bacterium]